MQLGKNATSTALLFVSRENCPACDGIGNVRFSELFTVGATWRFMESFYKGRITKEMLGDALYTIRQCEACGLYYQEHILDEVGMEYFYDNANTDNSFTKRETAGRTYYQDLLRNAGYIYEVLAVNIPRSIKVLDFGMGWGHWAYAARAHGFDVVGAELSPTRREFAAKNGIRSIDVFSGYEEHFDFINTDQVVEHLTDPFGMITALAARLKKGGVLKIYVPPTAGTESKLRKGWKVSNDELQPIEHINAFTRRSLDIACTRVGLKRLPLPVNPIAQIRQAREPNGFFQKIG
jgi:hypothetical protein